MEVNTNATRKQNPLFFVTHRNTHKQIHTHTREHTYIYNYYLYSHCQIISKM